MMRGGQRRGAFRRTGGVTAVRIPQESLRFSGDATEDAAVLPQELIDPDTSIADYVWLPLRFEGEMAFVDWHDEWRIEGYD